MQLFYPFICIFHLEDQFYKKRKWLHATCLINEILLDVICKPLAHFFFLISDSFPLRLLLSLSFSDLIFIYSLISLSLSLSLSLSRLMKILNLRQVHWFKPPLGSQAHLPKLNKIVMHNTQRLMW